MTIRTARGGRAWAREKPTQLELVQSHLENKFICRAGGIYVHVLTCITVSGDELNVRKQEKGSMSPRGRPTDTEYRPPSSPV